jgi:hypothetical protein
MELGRSGRTIADVGGRRRGATYGVIDNDRQNSAALTWCALTWKDAIETEARALVKMQRR